jgi:Na+-driven multidrug efflux pump
MLIEGIIQSIETAVVAEGKTKFIAIVIIIGSALNFLFN